MVTVDIIYNTFKNKFEQLTHREVQISLNSETGEVTTQTVNVNNTITPEVEGMVKCLIEAFLKEIKEKGIEMGDSKATKLEVG